MMNDVRFLGGHGTPKADGSRENPYNTNHTSDPDPIATGTANTPASGSPMAAAARSSIFGRPPPFAPGRMLVSDTETEGRRYQMSSEHPRPPRSPGPQRPAHWRFYALQTEAERGGKRVRPAA